MAQILSLRGAEVKIYIGGKLFPSAQSVDYVTDYGVTETYGVDDVFPQELAISRISYNGTITGIRIKAMGGLQGAGIVNKITDILRQPYVSIRITDRQTDTNLIFIPEAMVSNEQIKIMTKGVVKVSFSFKGSRGFTESDLQ
jgi:hypothetical protein